MALSAEAKLLLAQRGWIHLSEQSESEALHYCNELGEIIFTTDVVVKPDSKSMVTSARKLNLHSDHPKANYICWYCFEQTDEGGETLLLDAQKAFNKLSEQDKKSLHNLYLKEHKVFSDDKDFYPLVKTISDGLKFYFSFWLLNEADRENPALQNFIKTLENCAVTQLKLAKNDILIVDNDRILHGRTSIAGSKNRHLRRFWISKNIFFKQSNRTTMSTSLILPSAISELRIAELIGKKIDADIASIDLEMVKMKLCEPSEGIGWTRDQVEDAEIEYKRYLHLTRHFPYPTHSVVPNKIMDIMWHYHILDTRAYHKDCQRVFGHYLHHFPYFGLRGDEDEKNLHKQFECTKEYYLQAFGENMARNREADCWHDCEDRCWHACSDDK